MPHSDIILLNRPFQAKSRGGVQTKTFRKGSEASLRAEGGRSQRSNSEAVLFRGTLPRRYSIRCSQRGNNSATPHTLSTTFAATPLSTYLSCVGTARRYRLNILSLMSFTCAARASFVLISSLILSRACITVVWSRPPKYSPMDTKGILCPKISQIR